MTKRQVPAGLKALLQMDIALTNKFCSLCESFMPFRSLKVHYKVLEISCHGIVWLAGWLVFIWLANNSSLYQLQVNFYFGKYNLTFCLFYLSSENLVLSYWTRLMIRGAISLCLDLYAFHNIKNIMIALFTLLHSKFDHQHHFYKSTFFV